MYKQIRLNNSCPNFFKINVNVTKIKITIQLRLASKAKTKLYSKKRKYVEISNEICTYCNTHQVENLQHLLAKMSNIFIA